MNNRNRSIDVAKGLLILIVVIHHQPQLAAEFGISNPFLGVEDWTNYWYVAFFMPAFFVITGYCTDFMKLPFRKFLYRQLTTIMLPALCLGAVSVWISLIGKGCYNPLEYCKIGFKTFAISGGAFWFLPALFLSKILYRLWLSLLRRIGITSQRVHIILTALYCMGLFVLACVCHSHSIKDVWYFEHGLALTMFLFVGRLFKQYPIKQLYLYGGIIYVVVIALLQWAGVKYPYITAGFRVELSNACLFVPLAVTGTMLILLYAERISKNRLLEYFGRASLIVYTLHISVLSAWLNIGKRVLGDAAVTEVWFSIAQLILTLLLLVGLIWLLNLKYLRILTGRIN